MCYRVTIVLINKHILIMLHSQTIYNLDIWIACLHMQPPNECSWWFWQLNDQPLSTSIMICERSTNNSYHYQNPIQSALMSKAHDKDQEKLLTILAAQTDDPGCWPRCWQRLLDLVKTDNKIIVFISMIIQTKHEGRSVIYDRPGINQHIPFLIHKLGPLISIS